MHLAPWLWFAVATLFAWGVVGLLQKLSTNHISAESTLIGLVVGYVVLEPAFYPGRAVFSFSKWNVAMALLAGLVNTLGAWALFAAMKSDGKASIVVPLTALYPLLVVLAAPFILRESITWLQVIGILCSLIAVVLLSSEGDSAEVNEKCAAVEASGSR
jgi:transporter family protein